MQTIMAGLKRDRIGLLKMDIEGHEETLFAGDCAWLDRVDAMCLEYHADGAETKLAELAAQYSFAPPRSGAVWLLTR